MNYPTGIPEADELSRFVFVFFQLRGTITRAACAGNVPPRGVRTFGPPLIVDYSV